MATFSKWVKKAVETLVDPDKEGRVEELVRLLDNGLRSQRQSFSLAKALQDLDYTTKDVAVARERVYQTILARGWKDERLSPEEQDVARWVAKCLEIPAHRASELNLQFARHYFAAALAEAMEDGILDETEAGRLQRIATSVGLSLPQFARTFFREQGEGFLRGIFLACVADNHISQSDWDYLLWATEKLGLTRQELLVAIQLQAEQFVEHVLADAKADGKLSDGEDRTLAWLTNNLGLSTQYRQYVQAEVSALRTLTGIQDGKLPIIAPPGGIGARAGELIHWHSRAIWRQVRMLKSGPRTDDHHGTLTLTDSRLILSSYTKSQEVSYRRIVFHRGGLNWFETQVEGRPASTFFLDSSSPIPYAILSTVIAMANQTKVARLEGAPLRHIPRDVRQRVWQRYGGQCAECGAKDYLEFDHIVPVAKGGSNSDANVQLLCRRCNLKKSDRI